MKEYIVANQLDETILVKKSKNRLQIPYEERAKLAVNPMAAKLFKLMTEKQSNLCVAADLKTPTEILNLAEAVGPFICVFKTHIDIMEDYNEHFIQQLQTIAKKHNFILFEDRKFADIGQTVESQYRDGVYNISRWAELVTCLSLFGKGVLDGLKNVKDSGEQGVFLLAETSAAGALIDETFTKNTVKMAIEYPDLVVGLVCQNPLFLEHPGLLQLTPGVQLNVSCDSLGQQYNSPETVIQNGADIAVVGRGITKSCKPADAAVKYQKILWDAYLKRVE